MHPSFSLFTHGFKSGVNKITFLAKQETLGRFGYVTGNLAYIDAIERHLGTSCLKFLAGIF